MGIGQSKSRTCTFVHSAPNLARSQQRQAVFVAVLLVFALLLFGIGAMRAAQVPDFQNPTSFFTNVASRLLQAQLGVDLNRIQIYPTNQYTPGVHRLLQLTANVYDAATNRDTGTYPFLPTVFRPLFTNDNGAIYITGYVEEPGLGVLSVPMREVSDPNDRAALQRSDMIYGVPIVIGAKKGFPSFNEFGLLNDIKVSRTLRFHRSAPGQPISQTNQAYSLTISNALGIEAWNSYSSAFPRALEIRAAADIACSATIGTNSDAFITGPDGSALRGPNLFVSVSSTTNWPAFTSVSSTASFIVPIFTNYILLTNAAYSFVLNQFLSPGTISTDPANMFTIPDWRINLSSRLRFALVDTAAQRIVDYVSVASSQSPVDITAQLVSGGSCVGGFSGNIGDLFCTNRLFGSSDVHVLPFGLLNQINIAAGNTPVSDSFWITYNGTGGGDRAAETQAFRARITGQDPSVTDFATPFNPLRTIHQNVSWQANDPLVHYLVSDLVDPLSNTKTVTFDIDDSSSPLSDLGPSGSGIRLNPHYRPWAGIP